MELSSYIETLKQHISSNRTKEALELLASTLEKCKSEIRKECLLLSNRFHQLNAKIRMGILDEESYNLQSNQLVYSLLKTIEHLEEDQAVQDCFSKINEETILRELAETLHRHEENTHREIKSWVLTNESNSVKIKILTDDSRPQGAFYEKKNSLSLGRSFDNDIVINNPHVSREHAFIFIENDIPFIKDLGSTNGTFNNGKKVIDVQQLENGRVTIDQTIFTITL